MTEGPQATIKNVTIAGNDKTNEYVIRRELFTIPGDKFSRSDVIRTTRQIANLGFFNQEKIAPGIKSQPGATERWISTGRWKRSRGTSWTLSRGLGRWWNRPDGYGWGHFCQLFHPEYLPWGCSAAAAGRRWREAEPAYSVQWKGLSILANFSFTQPWLGGKKRNSLTVSLYRSVFRTGGYNYRTSTYSFSDSNSLKNFGVTVALGKQLSWPDNFFTLTYSVNYTQYDLTNYPLFTQAFRNGRSTNFSFKVALSRYNLDQPIYPPLRFEPPR